jgi:thiamine-monophosphate kinase
MPWDEDSIHRWLARSGRPRGTVGGLNHDAAVLGASSGRTVHCVDQTVEGVHVLPGTPAARVGRKACARALSDLAATAAHPRAVLCALVVPPARDEAWIRGVISGVRKLARECGADLVGGDLAAARGRASISVTAFGELGGRKRPPARDRAQEGQRVVLTGPVGGSSLGRHLSFVPRLAEGRWLHERGATAMMDVSDGLAWDLYRLARSSGVRIELDHVPVHAAARRLSKSSGKSAVWHALHDGEDHELIATLAERDVEAVLRAAPARCEKLVAIGRVRAGKGVWLRGPDDRLKRWSSDEGGWRHGG